MQIMVTATAYNMVFEDTFLLHRRITERKQPAASKLTVDRGCLVRPVLTDTNKTGYLCLKKDFSCTSMIVENDWPPGRLKSLSLL